MAPNSLITETGIELRPDVRRVIARFFVAGVEDVGPGDSRASSVIERNLGLDERDVEEAVQDLDERFAHRHPGLNDIFDRHANMVVSRVDPEVVMTTARRHLLGASFTHEVAIEGAAICNPSAVLHPEQDASGDAAFILSVRCIAEGHRSSIGFRTGRVTAAGTVTVDPPAPFPRTGTTTPGLHHRSVAHAKLADVRDDHENASYVLDALPPQFEDGDLEARLLDLGADVATRRHPASTIDHLRDIARSSYRVVFPATTDVSERVLWPHAPAESHGIEDARFVRFVDDRGGVTYYATYTAFDGVNISQHLLETPDFMSFAASPMAGAAAVGKGLALFPRMIGGRYVALSRSDRETNSIALSDDLRCWTESQQIQVPVRTWEVLQLGNCGSPIETEAGWLVLTHGVGPMRTYSLGAILLDLERPEHVLASAATPIVSPDDKRRDGYVPNVVYSCGAFAHNDTLVLPYGIGDQTISIATLSIAELLQSLHVES